MSTRTAQLVGLRRATFRSVRWPPAIAAVLIVAGVTVWRRSAFDDLGASVLALRTVAMLLAIGAVFVLDDDAAVSIEAAPTPLWWRRVLRYGVATVCVLPVWTAVVIYATSQQPGLPWLRLSLEFAALLTLGLAVGSAAARWWSAIEPGMTAALTVLGFTFIAAHLPPRLALFTDPEAAHWTSSTLRWWGLLVAGIAVLTITTRDPARQGARLAWRWAVRRDSGPGGTQSAPGQHVVRAPSAHL